ncbi:MAG TPA: hypothetical protein VMW75_23385, partial [Thermoanaerobaculia bacterium]|nr:hypothetical protein [Thermoanaerobaculia bacterium]
ADGTNAHTVVKEIRKPETDLFTPVVNPQTGDVSSFDRRTGNLSTGAGNIGRRSGLLDHDAARAIGILSGGTADPDFVNAFKVTKPGPPDANGNPTQIVDIPASIAKYKQVVATPGDAVPAPPGSPPAASPRAVATPPPIPDAVLSALAPRYAQSPDAVRADLARRFAPRDVERIMAALSGPPHD